MKIFAAILGCAFLLTACLPQSRLGWRQTYQPVPQQQSYQQAYNYGGYSPAPRKAVEVIMYTTKSCGYCQDARAYLNAQGIQYTDYDIHETEQGKQFSESNSSGVPVLFICGQRMNGWGEGYFQSFYTKC